jgi:hypothetical protein
MLSILALSEGPVPQILCEHYNRHSTLRDQLINAISMPPVNQRLRLTGYLALASLLLTAYEFMLTRAASLYYFFDVAYLVLAICLFTLSVGALAARRHLQRLDVKLLFGLQLGSSIVVWPLVNHFHLAWISGLFSLPFLIFGALAARIWFALSDWGGRTHLYAAELVAGVCGLALLGPVLVSIMPLNVTANFGVQTHLKRLVSDEGLIAHVSLPSAWTQTDLIRTSQANVRYVFTDGMFVTRAVAWDGVASTFDDPAVEELARIKRLAMAAATPGRIALLGAGAGFDIALALQSGYSAIDVVEINSATLAFARQLDAWSGGVMSHPTVTVYEDDARRFIQRQTLEYDHINITLIQTAPANTRARHHVAARILTREAIETYLGRLSADGVLSIIQNTDAIAAVTAQLLRRTLDSGQQLMWFTLVDSRENPFRHLFLVSNHPMTSAGQQALLQQARQVNAVPRPVPAQSGGHYSDVTDDRPFFFEGGTALQSQSTAIAGFCLLLIAALTVRQRSAPAIIRCQLAALLAGASALAFQIIAIYHVQAVVGLPGLALSAALAAVLGGAGLGAIMLHQRVLSFREAAIAAALAIAVYSLVAPLTASHAHQLPATAANTLIILLTVLCSLPIGLPFLATMQGATAVSHRAEAIVIGFDGFGGMLGVSAGTTIILVFGYLALGLVTATALLVVAMLVVFPSSPQRV